MARCDRCGKKAIVFIRYSGAHLCTLHFCDYVERRVKHEIRLQVNLRAGKRIAVAASGGKDSTTALRLIHDILGRRRDIQICAITVDEGIKGYRESSIPIVERNCRYLGIEHRVVSLEDLFGITMDQIAAKKRAMAACSYCGVLRRAALNREARAWKASHVATGHNLDDTAQSIVMNFFRGDMERLARLGPHMHVQRGLVPRIQPLRMIPESETTLYAIVKGLEFHDLECPYAPEALRNTYREIIFELEDKYPGTRHSVLRSFDEMRPALDQLYKPARLGVCECGEPTVSTKCKACELLASLKGT